MRVVALHVRTRRPLVWGEQGTGEDNAIHGWSLRRGDWGYIFRPKEGFIFLLADHRWIAQWMREIYAGLFQNMLRLVWSTIQRPTSRKKISILAPDRKSSFRAKDTTRIRLYATHTIGTSVRRSAPRAYIFFMYANFYRYASPKNYYFFPYISCSVRFPPSTKISGLHPLRFSRSINFSFLSRRSEY